MASPRILQRSRWHGVPFCPKKNPNEVSLRWIHARSRARAFRFVFTGFVLLLQRYSLTKAGVDARVVEAFDINDVANDVYEYNFGHRPYQGNIQSLTAADLDRYEAQAWLLSPPCQPYTRQGLQKQSGDARAFSFLRILELIPHLSRPPIFLFVENVVGFETSDTHAKMIETLKSSGFVTQEFILSPLQFGVPYSRPRYFCLAKRNPSSFWSPCFNDKLIWCPSPLFVHDGEPVTDECLRPQDSWDKLLESCVPVDHFLESKSSAGPKTAEYGFENANSHISRESNDPSKGHDERNGFSSTGLDLYHVPLSLIERWGSAMDIVYPDSRRCCCFTKSYYRYIKGTGSLLATVQPEMKGKGFPLKEQCLRYFTPREVANFHSFPEHFIFPDHVNLKQRYALLGNSLSVAVVAPLLHYLFTGPS